MNVVLRLRLDGDSFEGSFEAFPEDFEQGSTDQFEGKYNFKHHPIIFIIMSCMHVSNLDYQ